LEDYGLSDRLYLPDKKFSRNIGIFTGFYFDPKGNSVSVEEWERRRGDWLPVQADKDYLKSIMAEPIYEPGVFANYIAPPRRGINRKPLNFEYVRTES
jgi:benzoyl-CoA 2,3-dioxygenase component B